MKMLRVNSEGKIKLVLSFSMFIFSVFVFVQTKSWVSVLAMGCSSLGDISIMASRGVFNEKKYEWFNYGVLFFGLAHIFYMFAMQTNGYTEFVMLPAVIGLGGITYVLFNPAPGRDNWIMACYACVLILDFVNAFKYSSLAIMGLGFFVISDGILALKENKERFWQIPIWVTYVAAQVLILTSILIN